MLCLQLDCTSWRMLSCCFLTFADSVTTIELLASLVEVKRNLARVLLANPSIFMVPRKLVFKVLMGLYLHEQSIRACRFALQPAMLLSAWCTYL